MDVEADCQYVINYCLPPSGRKYLERLKAFSGSSKSLQSHFVITLVEESELSSRRCREVVGLLRRAKRAAASDPEMSLTGKEHEFTACLQQLDPAERDDDEDGEEEEGEDEDVMMDGGCGNRRGCHGRVSYHAPDSSGS